MLGESDVRTVECIDQVIECVLQVAQSDVRTLLVRPHLRQQWRVPAADLRSRIVQSFAETREAEAVAANATLSVSTSDDHHLFQRALVRALDAEGGATKTA